jgi:hypothetical protein
LIPCFFIAVRSLAIDEKMANLLLKRAARISPELYPRVSALNIFDTPPAFKGKGPPRRRLTARGTSVLNCI